MIIPLFHSLWTFYLITILSEYDKESFVNHISQILQDLGCTSLSLINLHTFSFISNLECDLLLQWERFCFSINCLEFQGCERHGKPNIQWRLRQRTWVLQPSSCLLFSDKCLLILKHLLPLTIKNTYLKHNITFAIHHFYCTLFHTHSAYQVLHIIIAVSIPTLKISLTAEGYSRVSDPLFLSTHRTTSRLEKISKLPIWGYTAHNLTITSCMF